MNRNELIAFMRDFREAWRDIKSAAEEYSFMNRPPSYSFDPQAHHKRQEHVPVKNQMMQQGSLIRMTVCVDNGDGTFTEKTATVNGVVNE